MVTQENEMGSATGVILRGIESFLQELVNSSEIATGYFWVGN
jgi:hypothetical protein